MNCIFCQIIEGTIPSTLVYEDEQVVAFRDIHPQAPVHILIIPRRHITSLAELTEAEESLAGHMVLVATTLAKREGILHKGFRLVINSGPQGGQLVGHLHLHLLGGRELSGQLG